MSTRHILKTRTSHCIAMVALLFLGSATALASPFALGVTLNTISLEGLGQFSLAFQLEAGSGLGDANNTVSLSNFNFHGGTVGGVAGGLFGGASGNLLSGVSLTDSDPFFNAMFQSFTPGASVTFVATFSNNADVGPFQDLFAMSLLDGSGAGIPTLDPSGNDTLMSVNMNGTTHPAVGAWGSDPANTNFVVPAPSLSPEPGSLILLGGGLAGLGLWRFRRR